MALTQAVRFRWLEAQLTIKESHQFMNKLLDENRDMIMKALFNQILKETNEQQNNGNKMNNIISSIIQSRKKKPKSIGIQNIKLYQLPKRLIGVIASFLNQYEYFDFSFTNRFIYLGCNSPNMLHELDLRVVKNYSTINLKLFRSLNRLALTLTQCEELSPPINDLSQMNEFVIDGQGKTDIDINTFLTSNCINNNNIITLSFYDFDEFPVEKFMKLLKKFPNTKYLQLIGVYVNFDMNSIKNLYPKLKGLAINGVYQEMDRDLIQTFGNNLDFLSFGDDEKSTELNYHLENINFSKLEQLWMHIAPTSKSLNNILKTAKNLKKIFINSLISEDNELITSKEMKNITSNIIILCKSLEHIFYKVYDGKLIISILDGIEKGLVQTKNLNRNKMKIFFVIEDSNDFKPSDFVFNIGKIIVLLYNSQISDFMFTFELIDFNNETQKSILLQQLKTQCSSINIVISLFDNTFVITNNKCKINGFNESWKISFWQTAWWIVNSQIQKSELE